MVTLERVHTELATSSRAKRERFAFFLPGRRDSPHSLFGVQLEVCRFADDLDQPQTDPVRKHRERACTEKIAELIKKTTLSPDEYLAVVGVHNEMPDQLISFAHTTINGGEHKGYSLFIVDYVNLRDARLPSKKGGNTPYNPMMNLTFHGTNPQEECLLPIRRVELDIVTAGQFPEAD